MTTSPYVLTRAIVVPLAVEQKISPGDDQLSFSMEVLTRQGRISVIIRNSRERKLLHDYENALRMFRGAEDGAEDELKKFEGKTVGGYELITDIKMLIELEEADELDFESLYSPVGGKS